MLRNHFKVAWRSLVSNTSFSVINIAGLAIGMASFVLIALWMKHEITYDLFHEKKDRIYQVWNRSGKKEKIGVWDSTPTVLAPTLQQDFNAVEHAVRFGWPEEYLLSFEEKKQKLSGVFSDSAFLEVFSFPLIKGNPAQVLSDPHSIVITEKTAAILFGSEDPLGQSIRVNNQDNFVVTGILKDLPDNSRFQFDYLLSWSYLKFIGEDDTFWGANSIPTYVLLKEGADREALNAGLMSIRKKYDKDSPDDEMFLYPISRWRLYSSFRDGVESGGIIDYLRMLGILALFVLLIACINFMNLSTAKSEKRAREVGVRKVTGATRSTLIGQFMTESLLLSALAGVVALVLVQLTIAPFGRLTGKVLTVAYDDPWFWVSGILLILVTGVLAGSYPAFFLSSFKPVTVLKGGLQLGRKGITPRKAMVVLQFTIAVVLIVCTLVVRQQINFARERILGYDQKNLICVSLNEDIDKHYAAIKNELIGSGITTSLSRTRGPITERWGNSAMFEWTGKEPGDRTAIERFYTDDRIGETIGFEFVSGRDFDLANYPTDSTGMILNESAVKIMGFADPIGQIVRDNEIDWHVIGVIRDFILESPYKPIAPLAIEGAKVWFDMVHFRLNDANSTSANLERTEAIFRKYSPDHPFEYRFIDEAYDMKFKSEKRTAAITSLFSGLTIFISCLGLFGLAAYMAESRFKEIGIRKVLGASVVSITTMLSRDFLILVVAALLISVPIAWWISWKWLQGYPYRTEIHWWIFVAAGVCALLIAFVTVSSQSVRAAMAKPAKSLRTE